MPKKKEHELPHKTIKKVQKGLESLKKRVETQKAIPSKPLLRSIKDLKLSMDTLSALFKEATKEIEEEEETAISLKEKIEPLAKKINEIESENKKIAQAILTVVDGTPFVCVLLVPNDTNSASLSK